MRNFLIGLLFFAANVGVGTAQAGLLDSFKKWATGSGTDVFEAKVDLDWDQYEAVAATGKAAAHTIVFDEIIAGFEIDKERDKWLWRCDLRKEEQRICRRSFTALIPFHGFSPFFKGKFDLVLQGFSRAPDEYDLYFVPKDSTELISALDLSERFGLSFSHTKEHPLHLKRSEILEPGKIIRTTVNFSFNEDDPEKPITHSVDVMFEFQEVDP